MGNLRFAIVSMVAILLTLGTTLLIDPEVGPSVLGIALAMTLSRSQLERDWRGRLEALALLPLVGLITVGVGFLILDLRWLGAAVFAAGMAGSILLRRFGGVRRRIGSLLALPFVALLVTPGAPGTRYGATGVILVPIAVGLSAWVWVTLVQTLARRIGMLPPRSLETDARSSAPAAPSALRPSVMTRLALQMGLAIAAAFVVGYLVFPQRWAWIVLTAMIVGLGNRGRADVVHKSIHRVVGAAAGTLLALLPIAVLGRAPVVAIAVALLAVFVGTFARGFGYGWWALAVTVALAIVQQLAGAPQVLLLQRWEEIVIGAVIGVASAWFVTPIRSGGVIRRRIAAVLAALQEQLAEPEGEHLDALDEALAELDRVSAPFTELTRVTRGRAGGIARWIVLTNDCADLGRFGGPAVGGRAGASTADARRALGAARRALRDPAELTPALERAREALAR